MAAVGESWWRLPKPKEFMRLCRGLIPTLASKARPGFFDTRHGSRGTYPTCVSGNVAAQLMPRSRCRGHRRCSRPRMSGRVFLIKCRVAPYRIRKPGICKVPDHDRALINLQMRQPQSPRSNGKHDNTLAREKFKLDVWNPTRFALSVSAQQKSPPPLLRKRAGKLISSLKK